MVETMNEVDCYNLYNSISGAEHGAIRESTDFTLKALFVVENDHRRAVGKSELKSFHLWRLKFLQRMSKIDLTRCT